ncbi:MAG: TolC family protein [Candidatus Polarisedimenticolaceae bacterium]|nr:TolC family protein [Candidatus Polarisedimenticolaceae bacterium]
MSFFTCFRAGLCACFLASTANAWSSINPSGQPSPSIGRASSLGLFINQILGKNPEIQAAEAAIEASRARAQGAGLPIYNPELELEGAKTEHTNFYDFGVGLSQTIDMHDKRGAQERAIQANFEATQSALNALRQTKAVELLDVMVRILNNQEITSLAKQRFQLLERFQTLAEQRHSAGDVPLIEVELARMAVAEAAMVHAQAGAELVEAKGDFFVLAGEPPLQRLSLPSTLPASLPDAREDEQRATAHPNVQQAHLLALAMRRQIDATDRNRRADPTLGVMAGREDEANKLTLSFSMPLQISNNFRSSVTAARSDALQVEQEAQQVYRTTLAQLQTARNRYTLISQAWRVWLLRGQNSLKQQSELLERLWRAGELETTDYLVQLQQTLDTRIAGAELHGSMWQAWIKWQAAAGQVFEWVNNPITKQPDATATSY